MTADQLNAGLATLEQHVTAIVARLHAAEATVGKAPGAAESARLAALVSRLEALASPTQPVAG